MRRPQSSLRSRITASIVLAGSVGLLAAFVILLRELVLRQEGARDRLSYQIALVARLTTEDLLLRNRESLQATVDELGGNRDILQAHLYDENGVPLASYFREANDWGAAGGMAPARDALPPGAPNWEVQPVVQDGTTVGSLAVRFESPSIGKSLSDSGPFLLLLLLGTTLAVLMLNRWAARSVLQPILGLSHAAQVISMERDYSIRALRMGDDEIGQLVDTFNSMLTQIELRDLELKYEMERAEAATRAKSQFLATMSHELRTPMNGVIGMSELLEGTDLNPDQRIFAETIQSSAQGLLTIINDILDFSKIESGHLELEDTELDLCRVVEESVGTLAHTAFDKGLLLVSRIAEDIPQQLRGDPARLRQVLLNLLSNALKFTPDGDVELRVALIRDEFHSVVLRFEIEDTGIGIPSNRMDRLFKSFSQVDVSDTRKYGGTGLGLAITKQIVTAMGGEIDVVSTEGAGSTFRFTARFGRAEAPVVEPHGSASLSPVSVVVAHAHPKQRAALRTMLGPGTQFHEADSPEAFRAHMEAQLEAPPDIAFVDVRFLSAATAPALGLFEAELARHSKTRIVLLAGLRDASFAVQWRGSTVNGFLTCPLRSAEVRQWIDCARRGLPAPQNEGDSEPGEVVESATSSEFLLEEGTVILVAEDNHVNQRVASRFLEKLGATVVVAGDGRAAVRKWRESNPALVLMDLQMPELDGLDATREIRRKERISGTATPIIALTANVGEDVRLRCESAGMNGHLAKPFQLRELREVLERYLPNRRVETDAVG